MRASVNVVDNSPSVVRMDIGSCKGIILWPYTTFCCLARKIYRTSCR